MKYVVFFLLSVSFVVCSVTEPVLASSDIVIIDPAPTSIERSDIVVSAVPLFGAEFLELHNQTDKAVSLAGYSVQMTFQDDKITPPIQLPPELYIVADGYVTLFYGNPETSDHLYYQLGSDYAGQSLKSVTLIRNDQKISQIENIEHPGSTYTWLKRKTGSAGNDVTMDSFTNKKSPAEVLSYGLFSRPKTAPGVQIVEVYPRASDCRPGDSSLLCGDYIKLYNPYAQSIDLSDYQLRSDSGSSASGNQFMLGEIAAGEYLTIYSRDDGNKLSLTDSGGFVWLEDRAGIAPYDASIVSYPSSSTSHIGWSWAQNSAGQWNWTSAPQPRGINRFVLPVEENKTDTGLGNELTPCAAGKFRNPETNRCKTIETTSTLKPCSTGQERNLATNRCRSTVLAAANLVPCGPGQTRNPTTNRCKSSISATASLVPCKPGQTRNPETNRCKSTSAAASSLVPCKPGQERNPETNRCRKSTSATLAASSDLAAQESATSETEPTSWYMLAGVVGVIAGGYGLWEWRSDIAGATRRLFDGLKAS